MKFKFRSLLFSSLLFAHFFGFGQSDTTEYDFGDFGGIIYLDSLVVTASRSGFDVDDFIQIVQEDESFYRAFRNLRFLSYSAKNEIKMFDKKKRPIASYYSITQQQVDGPCRSMATFEEMVSGKFYKKKRKYRYYTAKMYDRLFFTHQPTCESTEEQPKEQSSKGMSKHVAELKKLIFQPGSKADIPLIGKKTAIFDPQMAAYYDFSISSKTYKGNQDCYVFTAVVKPEYQERKKDKTVIKFLETYFDKENFQVIARNYQLAYQSSLFDFDVTMGIELKKLQDQYAPVFISYDGQWDVPGKKPEICQFEVNFSHFKE